MRPWRPSQYMAGLLALLAAGLVVSWVSLALPSAALADELDDEFRALSDEFKKGRVAVGEMLRGGTIGDRKVFDKYYETRLKLFIHPKNISNLPNERKTLKSELKTSGEASTQETHTALNLLLLERLPGISLGEYPPAVRVGATLMLGLLDAQEYKPGEREPVPFDRALTVLMAQYNNPEQIDACRVAAMVGILRHAELGISDNKARAAVIEAMIQTATLEQSPGGRSDEAHVWIRRRALDILAAMPISTADRASGPVVQQLTALMAAEETPIHVRCAAATVIGHMRVEGRPKLNYSRIASALASVTVSVSEYEGLDRRTYRQRLEGVHQAFHGVMPPVKPGVAPEPVGGLLKWSADTGHKDYVKSIVELFDHVMKENILNPSVSEKALSDAVTEKGTELSEWLAENPPPDEGVAAR